MFTPFKGGYAYGWMTGELAGRRNVRHGGGINGFITDISRFPDDDACVIVLSNFITGYIQETSDALAGILFGRAVEIPEEKPFIKPPARVLDAYGGNTGSKTARSCLRSFARVKAFMSRWQVNRRRPSSPSPKRSFS